MYHRCMTKKLSSATFQSQSIHNTMIIRIFTHENVHVAQNKSELRFRTNQWPINLYPHILTIQHPNRLITILNYNCKKKSHFPFDIYSSVIPIGSLLHACARTILISRIELIILARRDLLARIKYENDIQLILILLPFGCHSFRRALTHVHVNIFESMRLR